MDEPRPERFSRDTFLTCPAELDGMIYGPSDLDYARNLYKRVIGTGDLAWLRNPRGPLAQYWFSRDPQSVCFLINLAKILFQLVNHTVDSLGKGELVHKKFLALLRLRRTGQFEEALSELEVAHAILPKVAQVRIEPLVGPTDQTSSHRPKSPDFAFFVGDHEILGEATVIRVQILEDWHSYAERARASVLTALSSKHTQRLGPMRVRLEIPVIPNLRDPDLFRHHGLIAAMQTSEHDEMEFLYEGKRFKASWSPIRRRGEGAGRRDRIDFHTDSSGEVFWSGPEGALRGARLVYTVIGQHDPTWFDNKAFASIQNSLRRKKEQHVRRDSPFVVVASIGTPLIEPHVVLSSVRDALFRDRDYRWLSAFGLFVPRRDFRVGQPKPNIAFAVNDSAEVKLSAAFRDLCGA